MAFTLCIRKNSEKVEQEPCLLFDEEIILYFQELNSFQILKSFSTFDPYGDTIIEYRSLNELLAEANLLKTRSESRNLEVEPPKYVGLEGSNDISHGEAFGWKGAVHFAEKLIDVVSFAHENQRDLIAIGD